MIRRILVALDPDEDTDRATRYAVEIARRQGAAVTGLALVDLDEIERRAAGEGIGSMYYAENLRDRLTTESRETARTLISAFETTVREANVPFAERIEEGVPVEWLREEMKVHDLLIVGKDPHFFYPRSGENERTLDRVVKKGVAPVLVTGGALEEIERVLVAYDGSLASARTLQRFVQLRPFGTSLEVELVHVRGSSQEEKEESARRLSAVGAYARAHEFERVEERSIFGDDPSDRLPRYVREREADLLVAGAHSVSRVRAWMFGSTTETLLREHETPLFVSH